MRKGSEDLLEACRRGEKRNVYLVPLWKGMNEAVGFESTVCIGDSCTELDWTGQKSIGTDG
jgi:hypothetical protein